MTANAKAALVHRKWKRRHARAFGISSWLTTLYFRMHRPGVYMVPAEKVVKLLKDAKVHFVVMGTHGVGGWRSEPRATQDVDVLIAKRDHAKAVRIVHKAFPELLEEDFPVVTRFTDPDLDLVVLDLMKPQEGILRLVFRNSIAVEAYHRVPNLEMALVSKFAAMVSPNRRQAKKLIDGGDFVDIVEHNLKELDRKKLSKLAEVVYKGGGTEILKLVNDIEAGRRIEF